jgi:hypothetical protein
LSEHVPARLPLAIASGLLLCSLPLVAYLWFNLGDLLVGRAHPFPMGIAFGLLLFLFCVGPALGDSGERAPTS